MIPSFKVNRVVTTLRSRYFPRLWGAPTCSNPILNVCYEVIDPQTVKNCVFKYRESSLFVVFVLDEIIV